MHFLGRTGEERVRKAAEYLRRKQLPTGGWAIYEGGPAEVSSSVKAYFVLKLMGDDPQAPHMVRAREEILAHGGIEACNSFTRIYLAIFGQCSWDDTPAVPPEIMLLPDNFRIFNIYKMSSWSRAIVVPLSVIWASKPFCAVPDYAAIPELHVPRAEHHVERTRHERRWRAFFTRIDHWLKRLEAAKFTPLRAKALAACEQWMHERLAKSDGLGAIFPPIINTILAFRCLGYAMDDPRLVAQVRELEKLELEDEETLHVQPCFSPVWDTALVIEALSDAGLPRRRSDPAQGRPLAARPRGQGSRRLEDGLPGGRAGRLVLRVRQRVVPRHRRHRGGAHGPLARALSRRVRGPGAPGRGRPRPGLDARDAEPRRRLGRVRQGQRQRGPDLHPLRRPQRDDRSELRGHHGPRARGLPLDRRAARATRPCAAPRTSSTPSSCPTGPGTAAGAATTSTARSSRLRGLLHAGEDMRQPRFQKTADWIRACQNADGGWGELPHSYDDPTTKGIGPSTPSQTAWALVALFATGDGNSESVRRGIDYLLAKQQYDGSWKDDHWTATGFPKVFYLRYHLYATVFPAPRPRAVRARGRVGPDEHEQERGGRHRRAPHRSRSELMRFPVHMLTDNIQHQVKHAIKGNKRYPFVLMLEPLYTCNLACIGCAIERHTGKLKDRLSLEKCIEAVDITGAPVVSICGGEPTIYPELPELVSEIIKRKRQIILCTNGLLLDENLYGTIAPNKRLTINVHLDGMRETHDYVCAREGVFDKAIKMIRRGREARPPHDGQHHDLQGDLDGRGRGALQAADRHGRRGHAGLARLPVRVGRQRHLPVALGHAEEVPQGARHLEEVPLTSTPMFLEFAAGLRDYKCSPWSTVTYTPNGWKGPCYLIGKTWSPTYDEFWNGTDWEYWESRQDPLCKNCAMHSGFEASVVRELPKHPGDMVRMIAWNLAA